MKNILKYALMLIGLGFISFGIYQLYFPGNGPGTDRQQIFAMAGVGVLFLLGGLAMKKR